MKEIKKIAIITISENDKGEYVITGFTNTQINISAFMEEMRNMGAILNKPATEFTVSGVPLKRLSSCVNAYFGKGLSISAGQRSWKERLFNEVLNDDCIFKRDNAGIFIVDPLQLSGTINELKKDLQNIGVNAKKVVNKKRIYIELPSGVTLSSTDKKKKKPTRKKSVRKDNKDLKESEIVRYVGKGFDGFSKFNPKAKFFKYGEDNTAVIIYKKEHVTVKISEITRA